MQADEERIAREKRVLYLEPFSGISGDMMLGALLDLGCDLRQIREQLRLLPLGGYALDRSTCTRAGIRATRFEVSFEQGGSPQDSKDQGEGDHAHRSYLDIRTMIEKSGLPSRVKERSLEAFRRLAEAEARIHDQPPDEVHFHEVGAVDSILDIVGCMIALESLGEVRILSSAVNVGRGTVTCRHGVYPVPAPATQELLHGVPTYSDEIAGELTTPTGAALLVTLVEGFGPRPLMRTRASGYGAGSRDLPGSANVLRIALGEEAADHDDTGREHRVAVIEATIDDMNPQVYSYLQDRAFAAGAVEVYFTPIQMKKNRPAVLVTFLCPPERVEDVSRLIFAESTTIGLRYALAQRKVLERRLQAVATEHGPVTVKVSFLDGRRVNFAPEYEDCRRIARERGVPLKDVLAAATHAYLKLETGQ